jgi:hypothetical protein
MSILEQAPEGFRTFTREAYKSAKAATKKAGRLTSLGALVLHVPETPTTKEHWLVGYIPPKVSK